MKIIAQSLGKRYNREWIFKDLNYTFESGATYAITGPNGSGKSTLMQVLWAQVPQSKGELVYEGASSIPLDEAFKHVVVAAPYMDLVEELTLQEHVAFHFNLRKARNGMTVDHVIERMYLEGARNKAVGNFSSGMKQRVKLGLAFFTESPVVFLDEPGTNLDDQAFQWYRDTLATLPQETLTFIASNDPDEYPETVTKINIAHFKGVTAHR